MTDQSKEAPNAELLVRPWRKSTYSEPTNSVEVGMLDDGTVVVRNSREPGQGFLRFTQEDMSAFLKGAQAGEFDDYQ
jgi:hypothetical protein